MLAVVMAGFLIVRPVSASILGDDRPIIFSADLLSMVQRRVNLTLFAPAA